jgi:hypothetical protein
MLVAADLALRIAIRKMDVMRLGQQLGMEILPATDYLARRLRPVVVLSGDAGYSLTFLFIRQATNAIIALLHSFASCLF